MLVDEDGRVVAGTGRVNPRATQSTPGPRRAPDVVAAAHTHSVHGRAWSTLRRPLDPITQDACAFYGDHGFRRLHRGGAGSEEGQRIAKTLGANKAVVLANHGLLTVGASVGEAAWWFVAMDRCCQVQLLAEAAGSRRSGPEATPERTRR